MDFDESLAQVSSAYNILLKPRQIEALKEIDKGGDIVVNLPVGYGKSLLYQILPLFLSHRRAIEIQDIIIIVVSPLNIIQEDQMKKMVKMGISSCLIRYDGDIVDPTKPEAPTFKDLQNGNFQIVHAHPEALFNTGIGENLLDDDNICGKVRAIFIDECHIVEDWGTKFRPAFSQLQDLTMLFPDQPHIALTGTLTLELKKTIAKTLGLSSVTFVEESPHRPNIYLRCCIKEKSNDYLSIYEMIFKEEIDKLYLDPVSYPVTLMYIPLQYMAAALSYAQSLFGNVTILNSPFSALYSKQDKTVFCHTVVELLKLNPRIRLVFTTSVSGMGFDSPSIISVIHASPPRSISQYLQEIGRSGRCGQSAQALLYWNANDVSANLPGIKPDIITYCKEKNKCLWETILSHFGFVKVQVEGVTMCKCCEHCKQVCSCDDCAA